MDVLIKFAAELRTLVAWTTRNACEPSEPIRERGTHHVTACVPWTVARSIRGIRAVLDCLPKLVVSGRGPVEFEARCVPIVLSDTFARTVFCVRAEQYLAPRRYKLDRTL